MWRLTALAVLLVVATACSGDDGGGGDAGPSGPTRVTGAAPPTGTTGPTEGSGGTEPAGPAPDACALISSDEIEAITGMNPGVGSTSGGEDRSICIYEGGFITSVEIAANYEASKEIIEQDRPIEPVSDVGTEAYWDTQGQLVALGDDGYFVGVTIGARNEAAREQAARIATVMLENI